MHRRLTPRWLDSILPYNPGRSLRDLQSACGDVELLCLGSNENCLGASPRAHEAMGRAAPMAWLYPDGDCPYLRAKLAKRLGLPPEHFVFGAGSHEVLDLAVRAFVLPEEEVLTADVTFLAYKLSTLGAGRRLVEVPVRDMTYDLDAMARAITSRTKLILIANPNNPTGTIVRRSELETFIQRVPPDVVLGLDEAYIEYVSDPDFPDSLAYHQSQRRMLTLRTFSKIYGLAGCRIGYGIGQPDMIAALEKLRLAFNVNSIAQAAAEAALDDEEHVTMSRRVAQAGTALLHQELRALGLQAWPSHANFVLVDVGRAATALAEAMLKRGVIVRAVGPTLLRVTAGTEPQNLRCVKTLQWALQQLGG
ncbi:histidinol-phosphate transaminase [Myxococcota bacterium]